MPIPRHLLIIGAMKAGTTSLFGWLAQHPAIAPSTKKETNFFSHGAAASGGPEDYAQNWNWLPNQHRWAMEASPAYSKLPARPNAAIAAAS